MEITKRKISIIGGGTSGLFAAAFLDTRKYKVTIYEKQKSSGRKFLVAGDGGFNLTHSESLELLKSRYTPNTFLNASLDHFTNEDLREWLLSIGVPTFIGSSKRVFPKEGIKPIMVLKSMLSHLEEKQIEFKFGHTFTGWDKNKNLIFNSDEIVESDINIFALGGGSWKVTGSDGKWLEIFNKQKITTTAFKASNCAFQISWEKEFINKFEGQPFKNISISIDGKTQKGEIVLTQFGIEGNAIYALSPIVRKRMEENNEAVVYIDFKPTSNHETLINKFDQSKYNTTETLKRVLKLSSAQIALLKKTLSKDEYLNTKVLIKKIKAFPITLSGLAPIDEAISTAGGLDLNAVDSTYQLLKLENNYCLGEMLNWDAPTGGYLIQACLSMAAYVASCINSK